MTKGIKEETKEKGKRKRHKNSRLRLNSHAAVQGDGVKGVGEALLHVFLEIDSAGRVGAVVVAASGAAHVAN